jgi:hypothetical protein
MQPRLSRREQLIIETTERLRRVCAEWPPDEFVDLVLRVVDTTMKYEGATTPMPRDWAGASGRAWDTAVQ